MSQKVLGFSQQRKNPAMTWKNAEKLWYILTQAIEASQASQTISMGQNYFAACCEYCSQEWLLLVRE
jgi:hypothetical protein